MTASRKLAGAAAILLGMVAVAGCGNEQSRSQSDMAPNVKAAFEKSHAPPPAPSGTAAGR